jgi:hypothetical protein
LGGPPQKKTPHLPLFIEMLTVESKMKHVQ